MAKPNQAQWDGFIVKMDILDHSMMEFQGVVSVARNHIRLLGSIDEVTQTQWDKAVTAYSNKLQAAKDALDDLPNL